MRELVVGVYVPVWWVWYTGRLVLGVSWVCRGDLCHKRETILLRWGVYISRSIDLHGGNPRGVIINSRDHKL